jgi:DNA-binding transcriptional MerR regulator
VRIGELAALVGVTTRTIRHYHRIGLLSEPGRQPNGYRSYALRDAVQLARIRRLTELGLSLDEVKEVLADDAGKSLYEVLAELDTDLAREEQSLRVRRARLAELLEQAGDGAGLPAEAPVSPQLAALFRDMAHTAAQLPGPEPAMAAKERELLALLDGSTSDGAREWLLAMLRSFGSDAAAMQRAYQLYAQMDELADAAVDDPRVGAVAQAMAAAMPDNVADAIAGRGAPEAQPGAEAASAASENGSGLVDAFLADYAPAQAEAIRQAVQLLMERAR